jgi:hypothetical protein
MGNFDETDFKAIGQKNGYDLCDFYCRESYEKSTVISVTFVITDKYDYAKVARLIKDVEELLKIDDLQEASCIILNDLPSKMIVFPYSYILLLPTLRNETYAQEKSFTEYKGIELSLHDIHKLIKCSTFNLTYPEAIKSAVLGLIVMKKKELFIPIWNVDEKTKLWVDIILKHAKADGDVMDAHEELTRAGLKEFAKL